MAVAAIDYALLNHNFIILSNLDLFNSIGDFNRAQLLNEFVPGGWEHILKQMLLFGIGDSRIFYTVEGQLFQVPDVQLPPQRHIDKVERDARVMEEARVVAAD